MARPRLFRLEGRERTCGYLASPSLPSCHLSLGSMLVGAQQMQIAQDPGQHRAHRLRPANLRLVRLVGASADANSLKTPAASGLASDTRTGSDLCARRWRRTMAWLDQDCRCRDRTCNRGAESNTKKVQHYDRRHDPRHLCARWRSCPGRRRTGQLDDTLARANLQIISEDLNRATVRLAGWRPNAWGWRQCSFQPVYSQKWAGRRGCAGQWRARPIRNAGRQNWQGRKPFCRARQSKLRVSSRLDGPAGCDR